MVHPIRDPLTVYFDGDCPICAREIAVLKKLNRKGKIVFIDFADADYVPATADLERPELMRVIHARWADGAIITGVDVFRAIWTAIGFGFLARLSRAPVIDRLLVTAYDWFARNRLRLTGRLKSSTHPKDEDHEWPGTQPCHRCSTPSRPVPEN